MDEEALRDREVDRLVTLVVVTDDADPTRPHDWVREGVGHRHHSVVRRTTRRGLDEMPLSQRGWCVRQWRSR